MEEADEPSLRAEEIMAEVSRRLEKYEGLNTLELFAMFMGKAQILEFGLKNLLGQRCGYDQDKMKRWTLGTVTKKLKASGLRPNFIVLLESVVEYSLANNNPYICNEQLFDFMVIIHGLFIKYKVNEQVWS